MVDNGHDAAGGAHLDHPRVAAELLAHGPGAVVDAVGEAQLAAEPADVVHPRQREVVQVAVPAGGGEHRARAVHARPVEHPLRHRGREVDPEATDLPDRGHPGVERGAQVRGAARRPGRDRLEGDPVEVEAADAKEVAASPAGSTVAAYASSGTTGSGTAGGSPESIGGAG